MQAVQADWPLIQQLYIKGLPLSQIRDKTGVQCSTIASRASRHGWKAVAERTKQAVQSVQVTIHGKSEEPESNHLTKASASVRKGLSDELLRAVQILTATKPSKALRTQAQRASVMQTLAGAAKPVFGWSEGQSQPAVRISIMDSAVVMSQEPERPAIDVTPVPALPAPECPDQT